MLNICGCRQYILVHRPYISRVDSTSSLPALEDMSSMTGKAAPAAPDGPSAIT